MHEYRKVKFQRNLDCNKLMKHTSIPTSAPMILTSSTTRNKPMVGHGSKCKNRIHAIFIRIGTPSFFHSMCPNQTILKKIPNWKTHLFPYLVKFRVDPYSENWPCIPRCTVPNGWSVRYTCRWRRKAGMCWEVSASAQPWRETWPNWHSGESVATTLPLEKVKF